MEIAYFSNNKTNINKVINKAILTLNAEVFDKPYSIFKNPLTRFLCRFHFHFFTRKVNDGNPFFNRLWNKKMVNYFSKNETRCLIINSHFYYLLNCGFVDALRKKEPKVKVVFIFTDKVSSFYSWYHNYPPIEELKKSFDLVLSYNTNDVANFGITKTRPCFLPFDCFGEGKKTKYESDIFFVGRDKGRLRQLVETAKLCNDLGLVCDFYIVGVKKRNQIKVKGIKYNKILKYLDVIKKVKTTHAVLNIVQEGGDGVTMRDYEALGNDKYLITTSSYIKNTEFYNQEQIFGISDIPNRVSDIKNGYFGHNSFFDDYSYRSWFRWLISLLEKEKSDV